MPWGELSAGVWNRFLEYCQRCAVQDIFQSHINIDFTNMKCRSQLIVPWKISIANEYVLCRYEWHHPIVLIGHSFGGLVLKSLVVKLKRASTIQNPTNSLSKATVPRAKVFLRNVRGVAFYAVPHAGSSNIAKYVNKLLRCNNRHHPGIMDNIQPWQRDMEQLSVDFDRIVTENEINVYAFCEGRRMEQAVRMCWMKWIFATKHPWCFDVFWCWNVQFGFYDRTREFWWILARHNDQQEIILTRLRMPITRRCASLQVKNIPAMGCFYNLSLLVERWVSIT